MDTRAALAAIASRHAHASVRPGARLDADHDSPEAVTTVSDDSPFPSRSWLPTLNAGDRFTTATETKTATVEQVATVDEAAPEPAERNRNHLLAQDWSSALESQFGLTAPVVKVEPEESIAALKERLAYYEHFDDLIRDNIARSSALFEAVFAERDKARKVQSDAESTMSAVAAEADRRVAAERQHVQHILMSLMDEATFLHQRSDALIQRLAEALTEMAPTSNEADEPVSGA
jgi:hypothetical protein